MSVHRNSLSGKSPVVKRFSSLPCVDEAFFESSKQPIASINFLITALEVGQSINC